MKSNVNAILSRNSSMFTKKKDQDKCLDLIIASLQHWKYVVDDICHRRDSIPISLRYLKALKLLTPRMRSDSHKSVSSEYFIISIHAPRMRSDSSIHKTCATNANRHV